MYEKEFDSFGNIIQIENFQEVCLDEYYDYLDTVIEFKGTKENISTTHEMYKDSIINMILNSDKLKDIIMTEGRTTRHDKKIEETINVKKITENIFQQDENLNYFEERARIIIFLEIAKLINCYGMQELTINKERISKEMKLGIFDAKTDRFVPKNKLEKIEHRIDLDKEFGEEAIPYIENYELLKERVQSLREFTKIPREIQQIDKLIQNIKVVETMIEEKDNSVLNILKQCYSDYEKVNREILLARLNNADEKVINNPNDESLLLVHFIPDFTEQTDVTQNEFFDEVSIEGVKTYIESKYGRKYDPKIDSEEASEILANYLDSRKNPFDLTLRIPLKNRYTNRSFYNVITEPHTKLSCSIAQVGSLYPHLDRKIAIGFSTVPIDAIKTINVGYNNALDRISFEENSVAIPRVLEHIQKGGTNETLIDWTQIKPAYVMVVKDTEKISEKLLKQAKEYSNITGLPIQIYDVYEIEKRKNNPELNNQIQEENQPIEGAYKSSDLASFVKIKPKGIIGRIKSIIQSKIQELGGKQNENNR